MNAHSGLGKTGDPAITGSFSGVANQPGLQWIPGSLSTTKILTYGGYVELDARDKSKDLTRGYDIYVRAASSDGLKTNADFSDYSWLEGEIDARGYIPLGSSRTSLALRSRGQFKNPRGGSQIPFYDLSYLGGREYVRGYHSYRFRDNDLLMFSTELRQTVYKKTDHRGVDVVAFADSGQTWGDARSSIDTSILAIQHFSFSSWHSGAGGGAMVMAFQCGRSRSVMGSTFDFIFVCMIYLKREKTSPPESGGVARSAGVVPMGRPVGSRLRNHAARDPLRDPAALLTQEGSVQVSCRPPAWMRSPSRWYLKL